MYRVKKIVLSTAIFFILLYILMGSSIQSNIDIEAKDFIPKITIDVFKTSFKEVNITTGKYLDFAEYILENITAKEKEFRGYLYFAQPQTDWVITSQYINVILYFNGFDSRYFAGFSSPRIQFILASPNYNLINVESPQDDEVIVVVDSKYRFSADPIFQIIKEYRYLALYYPDVLSLKLNYTLIYMDTSNLASHLGIPEFVKYEVGRYNFKESPPVYILVNKKTYVDIITLLEPVVYGKLYTIELIPNYNSDTYLDKYLSTTDIINRLRSFATEKGLEDARIRSTNLISFTDYIEGVAHEAAAPYVIVVVIAAIAFPAINMLVKGKSRRRGKDLSIYIVPIYIVSILAIHYIMRWNIYIPLIELLIFLLLPTTVLIYLTFKGRI